MDITLRRKWKLKDYSVGVLYVNGQRFCETLEDTDRGLYQGMDEEWLKEKKVYGQTAIPFGRYRITLHRKSPKYSQKKQYEKCGGYVPYLLNVPAFSGILIHIGNYNTDTCGCILVGENKVKGAVVNSTVWFWRLYDLMKAADERGEEIWITIQP